MESHCTWHDSGENVPLALNPLDLAATIKEESDDPLSTEKEKVTETKPNTRKDQLHATEPSTTQLDQIYLCVKCNDDPTRRNEQDLRRHYQQVHKVGKKRTLAKSLWITEPQCCTLCGAECRTKQVMREHMKIHYNFFTCDQCGLKFAKLLDYVVHVKSHTDRSTFKCIFCDFEGGTVDVISTHLGSAHRRTRPFHCRVCNKGLDCLSNLLQHENFHTGLATSFCCEFCGKFFPYLQYLATHKINMHSKELTGRLQVHTCTICQKQYEHASSLKSHMAGHRNNTIICDTCGKLLTSKHNLKLHLRTHTGDKPFKCTHCGKCFTKKNTLDEHVRIHTGERPFRCKFCDKAFSQRTSRVIHMRTHTGERPFVCHICNKGFAARAMLNVHLKTCQGIKK